MNAVSLESLNGNAEESSISRPVLNESITDLLPDRSFRKASLNIDGLSTHLDRLIVYLFTNDTLAINESKCDESILDGEVNICGYDIVQREVGEV